MTFTNRVMNLEESATLSITALANSLKKQGREIIDFSAGEPDLDTPKVICDEAIRAINSGFTKYTAVEGIIELREAIAKKLRDENALDYEAKDIVVSNGAKQSLFNSIQVLIQEGDEVIIPKPYWVSYPEIVKYSGGITKFVETDEGTDFKITPSQLQNAITSKTKMIILCSPSNPSGMVYSKEEIEALVDILRARDIIIISDEIYEKLSYEKPSFSIATIKEIQEKVITINGLSKSACMTGWRVGYLAAKNQEFIRLVKNLQSHLCSNINSIAQKAAIVALNRDSNDDYEHNKSIFLNRRNLAHKLINQNKYLQALLPDGAFYLFINIKNTKMNSVEFCKRALEEAGVALVPGVAFGLEGYIRMSFASQEEQITLGCEKLNKFCANLNS